MRYFILFFLVFSRFSLCAEKNTLIVCENSLETLAWDCEFIAHAEQCIELASYCMGGTILSTLLEKIETRLQICPKIQVYMITSTLLIDPPEEKYLNKLQQKYPKNFHLQRTDNILPYSQNATTESHAKLLVVDEHYFSLGGTNLDEYSCTEGTSSPPRKKGESYYRSYLPTGTRDQDVVGKGVIVKDLRIFFHKLFALWEHYEKNNYFENDLELFAPTNHYTPLKPFKPLVMRFEISDEQIPVDSIELLISSPGDEKSEITQRYTQLIQNAEKEISISNLYFTPTEGIFNALLNAVNKNTHICLITNGLWKDYTNPYVEIADPTAFCWPGRMRYVPLFYGKTFHLWERPLEGVDQVKNTHIYEYHVYDVIYHKKIMVVDRSQTLIGSYNFSRKSDKGDYEVVLNIKSPVVAEKILKVFERDKTFSNPVSPELAKTWYFDPFISYKAALQEQALGTLF